MTPKPIIFAFMVAALTTLGGSLLFLHGVADAGLLVTGLALMTLTLFSRHQGRSKSVARRNSGSLVQDGIRQ
jgi:membrane protein implicated in regulation of membrane protease activity